MLNKELVSLENEAGASPSLSVYNFASHCEALDEYRPSTITLRNQYSPYTTVYTVLLA
jgi:hypothetical protein